MRRRLSSAAKAHSVRLVSARRRYRLVRPDAIGRSIVRVMVAGLIVALAGALILLALSELVGIFVIIVGAGVALSAPTLVVARLGPVKPKPGERLPPEYGASELGWILRGIDPDHGRREDAPNPESRSSGE
jgi:hypothetical protein